MLIKRRLILITIAYWVFLIYIIAALVWWFIALENQNRQMSNYKLSELNTSDTAYEKKRNAILNDKQRKTTQYVSEGATFMALIILGAVFMYRAVRRQFSIQRQQENLMMAITHELKTPIAVAVLNLETLLKHQLDDSKRQRLLEMTLEETNRLNSLASNILVSTQLEAGKRSDKEELNFSDLVKSCVSDFVRRFHERNWKISITEESVLKGDALLLQILVNNLLENAVKYAPPDSLIECKLKEDNTHIFLCVADEGHGIPVNERKKIFEKFYRIGNEETRSAKGTGLGLYLCRKIADDHGATIRIEENRPRGARFIVKFSKEKADQ
jgi:two-component system, OmpR family, sensor histidine kinase CiaH